MGPVITGNFEKRATEQEKVIKCKGFNNQWLVYFIILNLLLKHDFIRNILD